ncbi:hypothetical protein AA0473_0550 [Acetobacter orleanensis NRIC 0473]|nr:hypothetical protein AA0473_0550 [Acetobacter orleanensis NRIC 0473]
MLHVSGKGLFSQADVTMLDTATVIRLHLPTHPQVSLSRQSDGWLLQEVTAGKAGIASSPSVGVVSVLRPGAVLFPQKQPGRLVTFPDPASGGRLLIAPSREQTGGVAQVVQAVGYAVRPSLEGIVISAASPQIMMRRTAEGAVLDAVALQPLPVGQKETASADTENGAEQDREWLGLLNTQSGPEPVSRLASAQRAFAAGKPWLALRTLEKPPPQNAPAETNAEKTAETFLHAAASLLVGRVGQAEALNTAYFGDASATRVWRGLYLMQAGQSSRVASVLLAAGFAQMQTYPAAVRALILPQVANYIVQFGDAASIDQLGPLPDDSAYDLARALVQARADQTETARVALENLTASSSSQTAAYARAALVGLMLDKDMLAPAMAAEAYGKLLDNDGQPAALPAGPKARIRLGLAHALTLAGQPQEALAVLDKVQAQPDAPQDVLSDAYQAVLKALIFPSKPLQDPPSAAQPMALNTTTRFGLIASHLSHVMECAGKAKLLDGYGRLLLQAGQVDAAMAALGQATVLQDNPIARAEADDLLAQAALHAHRPDVAQRALDRAAGIPLPDDQATQRTYDMAGLMVERGEAAKALSLLAQDETDAGLDLRGKLYESEKRWPEAVLVVGRLAARGLPEEGVLTNPQQVLALRLATDAAAAQDSVTLSRLKGWLAGRTLGRERDALFAMQLQSIKLGSSAL